MLTPCHTKRINYVLDMWTNTYVRPRNRNHINANVPCRLLNWLKITYMFGFAVSQQLLAMNRFLQMRGRYLHEFILAGGVQLLHKIISAQSVENQDKALAIQVTLIPHSLPGKHAPCLRAALICGRLQCGLPRHALPTHGSVSTVTHTCYPSPLFPSPPVLTATLRALFSLSSQPPSDSPRPRRRCVTWQSCPSLWESSCAP